MSHEVDVEIPASVFQAQPGEVLRVTRSLHQRPSGIRQIAEAEKRAAHSASALAQAARTHRYNLFRLEQAKAQLGARRSQIPSAKDLVPQTLQPGNAHGDRLGRVTSRDRLTALTKTAGVLTLDCGTELRWTAAASYVDALEPLFAGVPLLVRGPLRSDGSLSIQQVKAAPSEHWNDGEIAGYSRLARLGQPTVTAVYQAKERLADQDGMTCTSCSVSFSTLNHASLVEVAFDTLRLVCRPCKEDWRDRHPGAVPAVFLLDFLKAGA
jgi:hypothetical protein